MYVHGNSESHNAAAEAGGSVSGSVHCAGAVRPAYVPATSLPACPRRGVLDDVTLAVVRV